MERGTWDPYCGIQLGLEGESYTIWTVNLTAFTAAEWSVIKCIFHHFLIFPVGPWVSKHAPVFRISVRRIDFDISMFEVSHYWIGVGFIFLPLHQRTPANIYFPVRLRARR